MRKGLSSLIVVAMLLMVAAPLLALSPQTLPACCRAGGKHHCAAMLKFSGEGFRAQMPPCPYRQHPAVAPAHSALQVSRVALAITESCSALYVSGASTVVVASRYFLPTRGPPIA